MLNPLFKASEASLKSQFDEIRFGIYEIDAFKDRYLNIMGLLKSAQRLPLPSEDHEAKAKRGLEKLASVFRAKRQKKLGAEATASMTESTPLLPRAETAPPTVDDNGNHADADDDDDEEEHLPHSDSEVDHAYEEADVLREEGEAPPPKRTLSAKTAYSSEVSRPSSRMSNASTQTTLSNVVRRLGRPFPDLFRDEIHRVESICSTSIKSCDQMLMLAEESLARKSAPLMQVRSNAFRVELKDIYQKVHQISQYSSANHIMAIRILHSPVVSNSRFGPRIRSELQAELKLTFEREEKQLQAMISHVETLFAKYFGVGDANTARFELLAYVASRKPEMTNSLALLLGFISASVIFTLSFVFLSPLGLAALEKEGLVRIYRGLSLLAIIPWMTLAVVMALRANRVNYIVLLNMDHEVRRYHDPVNVAYRACYGTLALIVNLIACLVSLYLGYNVVACACPALMLPFYLASVYASPMVQTILSQNSWTESLLSALGLCPPTFSLIFAADCATSLAKPFGDLARLLCHAIFWEEWGVGAPEERICATSPVLNRWIIPILAAFPLLVRIYQNLYLTYTKKKTWPFFFNALKYAFAHQVVILSTLRPTFVTASPLFFGVFVVTSLATFVWDVYVDWGLGRCQHRMLRDRLMFPRKIYYYAAIIVDFVLRFTWTLTLVSSGYLTSLTNPKILIPLGPNVPANFLELCRRTMWCILKIENEHLNNTMQFRNVDFVPLYFYEEEREETISKKQEADRERERSRSFLAAVQVGFTAMAVVSIAVWTLKLDESELLTQTGTSSPSQ